MSTTVTVHELPRCDFCHRTATFDGRTRYGGWAYMCQDHFRRFGVGLGVGKGQNLLLSRTIVRPDKKA